MTPEVSSEQIVSSQEPRSSRPTPARKSRAVTIVPPSFIKGQSGIEEAVGALAELLDLQLRSEPELETPTSSIDDENQPERN